MKALSRPQRESLWYEQPHLLKDEPTKGKAPTLKTVLMRNFESAFKNR